MAPSLSRLKILVQSIFYAAISLACHEIIGVGDGINRSSLVSFNCSRSKYGVFPHYFLTLCRPVLRFDSTGAYLGSGDKLTATHVFPNA
jgi:hypothetical protein